MDELYRLAAQHAECNEGEDFSDEDFHPYYCEQCGEGCDDLESPCQCCGHDAAE